MSDARASLIELAGVSQRVPQAVYTLSGKPLVRLRRPARGFSALRGQLELELEGDLGLARQFEMAHWLQGASSWPEEVGAHWRELIVEERLLSRPELVLDKQESRRASLSEPARAAVLQLRSRLHDLLDAPERAWPLVVCSTCAKARQEAEQAARLSAASRGSWYTPGAREMSCEHAPAARQGLTRLCNDYPELAFELLGFLIPAVEEDAEGLHHSPRFVLHPDVMLIILGHWLLGQRPSEWGHARYSYWDHSSRSRHRRSYRSVKLPSPTTALGISAEEQAAIAFSASAWGIDTPAEELALAWTAPAPFLETPIVPRLNATPMTALATRVLPEMVAPEHSASRETSRRKRG